MSKKPQHLCSIVNRLLVLGDIHFPLANERLLEKLFNLIEKKLYPESLDEHGNSNLIIVQNGDLCDFPSFSKYLQDPRQHVNVNVSLNKARNFWATLRRVAPNAELLFKAGNHDDRLYKYILEKAPMLIELEELTLENLYFMNKYGVKSFGSSKRLILEGNLKITHGDRSSSAGASYTLNSELKNAEPEFSLVTAHIHDFAYVRQRERFGIVCGFLGSMEEGAFGYVKDKLPSYRAGFVYGHRIRVDERDERGRFRKSTNNWRLHPIEAFGPYHDNFVLEGVLW